MPVYDNGNQQKIDELIARRRARTEELRRKRKRTFFLLLSAAVLVIALLVVLGIFLAHSFAGKDPATPPDSGSAALTPQQPPVEPDTVVLPDTTQPDEPEETDEPEQSLTPLEPEQPEAAEPEEPAEPTEPGIYADTVIFVDPGRGYSDAGGTSAYLGETSESEINLLAAQELAQLLREAGFTVVMTHETNEIPAGEDPEEYRLDQLTRAAMANDGGCDLYLSLHCDNFPDNEQASGTRLYYCTDSAGSAELADTLAAAIAAGMGPTPRISGYETDRAFVITSEVAAPCVLIEMGFITNPGDAENLLDAAWRSELVAAIAAGATQYALALREAAA